MYISDDLIFLELQKTGGSHILRLLNLFERGEIVGKHNRLNLENAGNHFIFGSIRNPWDWYVSLWAYGVGNKGAIRYRTTKGIDLNYYHADLPHDMGKNWLNPKELAMAIWHDIKKPTNDWSATYVDSDNAENFRTWLKMLLSYERRFDVGEGYAYTPLCQHSGLMTYRYFRLFTLGDKIYKNKDIGYLGNLKEFYDVNSISKGMIRTEHLEDDYIRIMNTAGKPFSPEQEEKIKLQKKTNTSKRKNIDFYYDQETIDLVADKESFIIEEYHYKPPLLSAPYSER